MARLAAIVPTLIVGNDHGLCGDFNLLKRFRRRIDFCQVATAAGAVAKWDALGKIDWVGGKLNSGMFLMSSLPPYLRCPSGVFADLADGGLVDWHNLLSLFRGPYLWKMKMTLCICKITAMVTCLKLMIPKFIKDRACLRFGWAMEKGVNQV